MFNKRDKYFLFVRINIVIFHFLSIDYIFMLLLICFIIQCIFLFNQKCKTRKIKCKKTNCYEMDVEDNKCDYILFK